MEGAAAEGCLKVVWSLPPFKAKSVKVGNMGGAPWVGQRALCFPSGPPVGWAPAGSWSRCAKETLPVLRPHGLRAALAQVLPA